MEKDLLAIYQGDPAAQSIEEVIMSYPGIESPIRIFVKLDGGSFTDIA